MEADEKRCLEEIALGAAIERLEHNPDFIAVIQKAFIQDHALECLEKSLRVPNDPQTVEFFKGNAEAGVRLKSWLGNAKRLAANAPAQLEEYQEARKRLAADDWSQQ